MPDSFTYDVFLSHSSQDKSVVRPLAERLRSDGLKVWFDEWEIKPGENILARIEDGLEHSRMLVLCMSANAFDSDWAQLEAGTFRFRDPLNRERHLIPLRLDEAEIKGALAQFRYINWNSKMTEEDYRTLLASCRGDIKAASERPRVCMISSEFPPHVLGGLGVHVTSLSAELTAYADVDLVLPYQKNGYNSPPTGIQMHSLVKVDANYDDPVSWLHFAQHAFYLLNDMSPKPEVVHCHDWVTVLCGIKCRYVLNIPLIFHVHLPNRTPFCSLIENLGITCADLVTVNSRMMLEQINERFPEKKVVVVPNGVDTTIFKPSYNEAAIDSYVLFAGRLVEQKGVDHLLRAFIHVLKRFPTLKLKLAGTGPCEAMYKRLADCLLIGDRVDFLGWKSCQELCLLYQSASVVVVPSVYEPFGMTALEAMACAKPVVASKTGGLKEIIQHGETGYLAEPGDHLDLAQWIIRLLEQKDLRQKIATAAGREVQESAIYRWPSIARQYMSFYHKLSCEKIDLHVPTDAPDYIDKILHIASSLDRSTSYYNLFSEIK